MATTSTSQGTEAAPRPSQSPQDAARDGVIAELAALSLDVRTQVIVSVPAAEGVWAISHPGVAAEDYADGCRLGSDGGQYPTDFICTAEYGEVLLLATGTGEIVRAYPFPGVPPEILIVTEDAVFCGRQGAGPLPDSMVCRIDRSSLDATVHVFPGTIDSIVAQPCYYPPGNWTISDASLEVLAVQSGADGLWVEGSTGWALLDPISLEIVEQGTAGPGESD